jgi:DNA repair exonuclease SbcCD ATPase subunit
LFIWLTFGVKVSEEVYDRVKNMVEALGVSAKEWFEKAVALTAVQDLKDGSGDYKQDLSELELHTTRIYELVANMIQRANYLKDDAVKGLETKLESRELTITELQSNVKSLNEELKRVAEESKQSESDKQTLNEQVEGLRSVNDNNQALIQEYKEKIDTLSSLVNDYKSYATENVELKEAHATEKDQIKAEFEQKESRYVSSIEELQQTAHDQQDQMERLNEKLNNTIQTNKKENESLKVNFKNQLTQLTNAKELEKERAILEVERKYQEKIQQVHDQYNEKLARLYEKFEQTENTRKKKKVDEN